jgi:ABC-2 type transport system ATP-binding protein
MDQASVVVAEGLARSFVVGGRRVEAVRGVNLDVRAGEVFGFLGPNGAGKTTTLRMLTTLLPIEEGEATVAGADVRREPRTVRRRIGYIGQLGGADLPATGWENLLLQGQLYGGHLREVAARAKKLVETFELSEFIDRKVSTWSGGQRRRLEVALGLIHRPQVLFLDEPTTGLDPQNRANLWEQLRGLRQNGVTIFLTTHYLEEADALSDHLAIIDRGRIVAEGTPSMLKAQVAGDAVVLRPGRGNAPITAVIEKLARQPFVREARLEGQEIRLYVSDGSRSIPVIFQLMESLGVDIEAVTMAQPTLDDVFLQQTGRALRDTGSLETSVVGG